MDTSNDGTTTFATDIVTHQMSLLRGGRGPSISGRLGFNYWGLWGWGWRRGWGVGSGGLPCGPPFLSVLLALFFVAYVPGATLFSLGLSGASGPPLFSILKKPARAFPFDKWSQHPANLRLNSSCSFHARAISIGIMKAESQTLTI